MRYQTIRTLLLVATVALLTVPAASDGAVVGGAAFTCQECFEFGPWYSNDHYFSDQGPNLICGGTGCHQNILDGECPFAA